MRRPVRRKRERWPHVVGFDDAPFPSDHRGNVLVIGAVFAGERLDGVLSCFVRRDGANATARLAACVKQSRFYPQLHAVLLQGIAFAGFNVVDIQALSAALARPVMVIVRRRPNLAAVRHALLTRVRGGERKWQLVERAGSLDEIHGLFVQRAGLSLEQAAAVLHLHVRHGVLPEPLRTAHLIAGGVR
ncbi:MAG: endonuclease dU [Gammaproteobacteria bacterium]